MSVCYLKHIIKFVINLVGISLILMSLRVSADLSYQLGISAEAIDQNIESIDENTNIDSSNVIFTPSFALDYQSKRLNGFWRATHNHIQRSLESLEQTLNYSNYAYGGSAQIVDQRLVFSVQGNLNYRSPSINSFLIDDFLINAENLTKVRTNNANLQLSIPRSDYFGLTSSISYSTTQSEQNETGFSGFNSEQISFSSLVSSGNNLRRLYSQVSTNVSLSRRQGDQGNYLNRATQAELSYKMIGSLGLSLSATNEGSQVSDGDSLFSNARDYWTYGAGITWRESNDRYITLTYNTSDGDIIGNDDEKEFLALSASWQFTQRTNISAQYGRRFFGESGAFSFSHSLKRFRTQISYEEDITSFSNLIADPGNLGVFVCESGSRDLAGCFQPSSISFELEPNQEFVQFSQQNVEINDELILRKALSWQLGFSQRRTSLSLNGRYSLNDFLESVRVNRTYSMGLVFGFSLGSKTTVTLNSNYAVTDNKQDIGDGKSTVKTGILSLKRDFGKRLNGSVNFRYVDRDTDGFSVGNTLGGIQGDLIDRRVSLEISYNYSSR